MLNESDELGIGVDLDQMRNSDGTNRRLHAVLRGDERRQETADAEAGDRRDTPGQGGDDGNSDIEEQLTPLR